MVANEFCNVQPEEFQFETLLEVLKPPTIYTWYRIVSDFGIIVEQIWEINAYKSMGQQTDAENFMEKTRSKQTKSMVLQRLYS